MFRTQTNRSLVRFIGVFAAVFGVVSPVLGEAGWLQEHKLLPSDGTAAARSGNSVVVEGGTALLRAMNGYADVRPTATDMFLKIEGIPGESTDDGHADWIEIVAFSHGVSQPVSGGCGTGGRTGGRADFEKHYSSVRMQQGRVQMDADWNEQLDIEAHRDETTHRDVIGHCGGSLGTDHQGNELAGFKIELNQPDLTISGGRYYVHGILCENDENAIPQVLMDGLITNQQLVRGNEPGTTILTVTGEDVSIAMDLEERSAEHPAQDETVIALKIIASYAQYGLIPNVIPPVALDIPLPIERIPGESTDDGHTDWIEIVAGPVTGAGGTGGRADFMPFSVTKTIDKASADLLIYCANGKHIPTVEVEFCLATGDKHCFMKYTMTDVIVSAVSPNGSQGGDRPMEEVSFTYGKIQWEYTPIDQAGAAGKCPWDLDGNNDVGVPDLLILLASWGPCKGDPADFDSNDDVGVSDLLVLLGNWGPCP